MCLAKVSPDAFCQQALQLAWFRDQGYATATYETASTRAMLHGRTDVIRSLSQESREWVKAMDDDKSNVRSSLVSISEPSLCPGLYSLFLTFYCHSGSCSLNENIISGTRI